MFLTISIADSIRIPPSDFGADIETILANEIDVKYANRVLPGVGHVVSLFAIDAAEESFIMPGDGGAYTTVTFRLLVFRPTVGEMLTGRVKAVDSVGGLRVSLDFFEDVVVPPAHMPEDAWFNANRWVFPSISDTEEFNIQRGDRVRFRVVGMSFHTPSSAANGAAAAAAAASTSAAAAAAAAASARYAASRGGAAAGGAAAGSGTVPGAAAGGLSSALAAAGGASSASVAQFPPRTGWMVVGSGEGDGATPTPVAASHAVVTFPPAAVGRPGLGKDALPMKGVATLADGAGIKAFGGGDLFFPPLSAGESVALASLPASSAWTYEGVSGAMAGGSGSASGSGSSGGGGGSADGSGSGDAAASGGGGVSLGPFTVVGSIKESGMGCVAWWDHDEPYYSLVTGAARVAADANAAAAGAAGKGGKGGGGKARTASIDVSAAAAASDASAAGTA